jgi:hypothetical protein
MALGRDRRRVGVLSAALSAGALVFLAAGATPASAETQSRAAASDCPLGKLLCSILGLGDSDPSSPPSSGSGGGGGGTTTEPSSAPRPKPRPQPAGQPPAHSRHTTEHGARGTGGAPPGLPAGDGPSIPAPRTARGQALPEVTGQDPLVMPDAGSAGAPPTARLVADSSSGGKTIPPLLVATASGLIGAVAALNLSVLRHRRQD